MAGQDKILGEQLDIIDVSLDISTDSVAITHIAAGLTTDSGAIAIIDADYLRRDGTVTMDGTLTITGTHDLVVGGNILVLGTVDGRDILLDAITNDAHRADGSIHFAEANIDHDNILNSGSLYTHAQIDSHIGATNIHFTTLDGLSDVTSPSPSDNQVLTYSTGLPGWEPQDPVTGIFDITAEPLGDLVDIILTGSPLLGQVLSYDGANWINSTPSSGVTDHTLLTSIGTNTHPQIDTHISTATSHIADGTIHFTEASISITKSQVSNFDITAEPLGDLSDVVVAGSPLVTNQVLTFNGTNWVNADVPTGITDHTLLTSIGTNTHAQIDTHISDSTIHFTEASISITKSQVSDFDITAEPLGDLLDVVLGGSPLVADQVLTYDGANWINADTTGGITDHTLLTNIGTNTHAQIDTHISDGTVHYTQGSISITKSQVTDFGITAEPLGDLSDVVVAGSPLVTNQVLTYDGVNWINADVPVGVSVLDDLTDVVIGGSPLTTNQVLTYDGSNWINADVPTSITDHTLLTNIGTNTHAQIDSHIADTTIHFTEASISITKSQVTDFGITAEPLGDLSDVVLGGSPLIADQVLTYDGANWINADAVTSITDHTLLTNIGTSTHAQIDTHISDGSIHYTQATIAITKSQVTDFGITAEPLGDLSDVVVAGSPLVTNQVLTYDGANWVNADVPAGVSVLDDLSDVVIGGSPLVTDQVLTYNGTNWVNADVPTSITDHTLLTNVGTNTHAQIDTHISDGTVHYTQATIAITKSQVTDFGITAEPLGDLSDVVIGGSPLVADQVLTYDGVNWVNSTPASGVTDHTLLTNIGTNTHTQIDTHISDSTLHYTQATIAITKTQVTDFGITAEPLGDLSDVVLSGSPVDGQTLTYDGVNWINETPVSGITDHTLLTNIGTNTHAEIDTHISDSTIHFTQASIAITKSQVTDFGITAEPLGDLSDVVIGGSPLTTNQVLTYDGSNWVNADVPAGVSVLDDLTDVVIGGSPLVTDQVLTYNGTNWVNADAPTSITNHTLLTNIGTNTHAEIDTHISDSTIHFTQAAISITKSQVTDFGITAEPLGDLSDVVIGGSPLTTNQVLTYDGANWINADVTGGGVTDHTLLTNIGTTSHVDIDTHISNISPHNNWMSGNAGVDFASNPTSSGGANMFAIGSGANATAGGSIAIGTTATSSGSFSTAIGHTASTGGGEAGTAIGRNATVVGANGVAIGTDSDAVASAVSIGHNSDAIGTDSVAMGNAATATTRDSIVIGTSSNAGTNNFATAIGEQANATGENAIALGRQSSATKTNMVLIGTGLAANEGVTDVDHCVKIGSGNASELHFMFLYSKGHLKLHGAEAQFEIPTYTTVGLPANPVEGSLVYNTTTDGLTTFNGATWNEVGASVALNDLTDVVIGGSPLVADQVLTYDGVNWINADVGGGGTPGGLDTQLQYNDGGVFGGTSEFTYDDANGDFTITGTTADQMLMVENTTTGNFSAAIYGYSSNTSNTSSGIWAGTESTTGTGLYAFCDATSGLNQGLYAETYSPDGRGVYALNRGTSGDSIGLFAETKASAGFAGYFLNNVPVDEIETFVSGGDNYLICKKAAVEKFRVTGDGEGRFVGGVDKLTTATGVVSVAASTAPSAGQVLTATSATVATWQSSGSTKPQYESLTPTGSPPSEIINTTVPTVAIAGSPQLAGVQVFRNGMLQDEGVDLGGSPATITEDFVVSAANQITFASDILEAGDKIKIFAFT